MHELKTQGIQSSKKPTRYVLYKIIKAQEIKKKKDERKELHLGTLTSKIWNEECGFLSLLKIKRLKTNMK